MHATCVLAMHVRMPQCNACSAVRCGALWCAQCMFVAVRVCAHACVHCVALLCCAVALHCCTVLLHCIVTLYCWGQSLRCSTARCIFACTPPGCMIWHGPCSVPVKVAVAGLLELKAMASIAYPCDRSIDVICCVRVGDHILSSPAGDSILPSQPSEGPYVMRPGKWDRILSSRFGDRLH